MNMNISEIFPIICALYVSAIYAYTTLVFAPIAKNTSWAAISIFRAGFALPMFIIWGFLANSVPGGGGFADVTWKSVGYLTVGCICTQGLADGLVLMAANKVGVATSLTISAIYPLWVALINYFLKIEGEKELLLHHWIGLLLTLIGIAGIIYSKPTNSKNNKINKEINKEINREIKKDTTVGYALSIIVSILWAISTYGIAYGSKGLNVGVANTIRLSLTLIIAPLFALILGTPYRQLLLPTKIMISIWLPILLGTIGFAAYIYSMTNGPIVVISTLSSIAPLFAVLIAYVIGKEKISLKRFFYIFITCFGAILLSIK
ncbi:MAG: DMT family transporter [Oligoflexia bacterium]|nr:DMT family transporter [Oligoflexia bacterium]